MIGRDPELAAFPLWINREFQRRANLKERWRALSGHPLRTGAHPIVPNAHASLSLPQWTQMFEQENAGVTPYPLEMRYPFLDLRIVNYVLAIPPFPWFFEKMILREAMAEQIPERVRMRPKTPLQGNPVSAQLKKEGDAGLNRMEWSKEADRFIERSALVPLHGKMSDEQIRTRLRPYCLIYWLRTARRVRYNKHAEARNG